MLPQSKASVRTCILTASAQDEEEHDAREKIKLQKNKSGKTI